MALHERCRFCDRNGHGGRSHVELEPLIGLFVNTIPFRANLDSDPAFCVFLQRVRQTALDVSANQDVKFEKVVVELKPKRSMSRAPLFQAMFIFHN